jgi:glycine cleavage system pyridoxal-binding protein P
MKQQLIDHDINISNPNNSLREFIIQTSKPAEDVILEMGNKGFLAGIKYSDKEILVAVTEKRTKAEIDKYVTSLQEVDNA